MGVLINFGCFTWILQNTDLEDISAALRKKNYRLLRRKIAPPYWTHYIEGVPAPTEAIRMRRFKANWPCAVSAGAEAAAMVDSVDLKIERPRVEERAF